MPMLLWVALFAALGGGLFGYDLGLIGPALLDITDQYGTSPATNEAIVGCAKLGAFLGTFLGGALMLVYGRRPAIATSAVFYCLGPVLMAFSVGIGGLVLGRLVVGVGIGVSAVSVPAYLGEVAPAAVRGRVVEAYELMLCVGMLSAALVDAAVPGWRWMVAAPLLPSLLLTLSACVLPESPRWLVTRGRLDEALAVMHRLHTSTALAPGAQASTAEVEGELLALWSTVEHEAEEGRQRRERHRQRRRGGNGGGAGLGDSTEAAAAAAAAAANTKAGGSSPHNGAAAEGPAGSEAPAAAGLGAGSGQGLLESTEQDDLLGGGRRLTSDAPGAEAPRPPPQGGSSEEGPARGGIGGSSPGGDGLHAAAPRAAAGGGGGGFWAALRDMLLDTYLVACGPERRAFRLALGLAVFNQAFASTAVINFAPTLLQQEGVAGHSAASLLTAAVGGSKLVGVCLAFWLVDSVGRRPLLLWGSAGCAAALAALAPADWRGSAAAVLVLLCVFVLCFSLSWAGVFWVLQSEMFSMGAKSPAMSASTAALFLTGAVSDLTFLSLHSALGPFAFVALAAVAAAAGVFVYVALPETKGRTLREVQALLAGGEEAGEAAGLVGQRGAAPPPPSASYESGVELPRRGFGRDRGAWRVWR